MAKRGLYEWHMPSLRNSDDILVDTNLLDTLIKMMEVMRDIGHEMIDIEHVLGGGHKRDKHKFCDVNLKTEYKRRFRQKGCRNGEYLNNHDDAYNPIINKLKEYRNSKVDKPLDKDFINAFINIHYWMTKHITDRADFTELIPKITYPSWSYRDPNDDYYRKFLVENAVKSGDKLAREQIDLAVRNFNELDKYLSSVWSKYFDGNGWCIASCQIGCQESCQISRQYHRPDENCKTVIDGLETKAIKNRNYWVFGSKSRRILPFTNRNIDITKKYNTNIFNQNQDYQNKGIPIILPYFDLYYEGFVVINNQDMNHHRNILNLSDYYNFSLVELYYGKTLEQLAGRSWPGRNRYPKYYRGANNIRGRNFAYVRCSNDYIVLRNFDNYTFNTHNLDYYKYVKYPDQPEYDTSTYSGSSSSCEHGCGCRSNS